MKVPNREKEQQDIIQIHAYILAGTLIDLSPIDFSGVNIACYNLKSKRLKTVSDKFTSTTEEYHSLYNVILQSAKKVVDELKYVHVLLPSDFKKKVVENDYIRCINLIKLLYPSDLECHTVARFNLKKHNEIEWINATQYNFYPSGADRYENFLAYPIDNEVKNVNGFIKLYFERIDKLKYVQTALDAYVNSFLNIPSHMAFVSLCMALETVVDGKNELMYRIRRTVALLCASNSHHAGIVSDNIKLIYELRSGIVHGEILKNHLIQQYLPYLQSIVSRMIIQLVKLNCVSVTELQTKMLFTGYMTREELLPNDKNFVNTNTFAKTYIPLKKR